jgi:hypothetical protein
MTHFYAEVNRYGQGSTTEIVRKGKGINVSAGKLYRFKTAAARNAFVNEQTCHAEAMTGAEARRKFGTGPLKDVHWEDVNWLNDEVVHADAGYEYMVERASGY